MKFTEIVMQRWEREEENGKIYGDGASFHFTIDDRNSFVEEQKLRIEGIMAAQPDRLKCKTRPAGSAIQVEVNELMLGLIKERYHTNGMAIFEVVLNGHIKLVDVCTTFII